MTLNTDDSMWGDKPSRTAAAGAAAQAAEAAAGWGRPESSLCPPALTLFALLLVLELLQLLLPVLLLQLLLLPVPLQFPLVLQQLLLVLHGQHLLLLLQAEEDRGQSPGDPRTSRNQPTTP